MVSGVKQKLCIKLDSVVDYSFKDNLNNKYYNKNEIDTRVSSFSHLNHETDNHISQGKDVSGMLGENLFKWLKKSKYKTTEVKTKQIFSLTVLLFLKKIFTFTWLKTIFSKNSIEAKIKIEFTRRVIGLINDLKGEKEFRDSIISFSGENTSYLNIEMLKCANIPFKITSLRKPTIFTGPLGGKYNANFLEALNANQLITLTRADIKKKLDHFAWLQFEKNYNGFISKLQKAKKNTEHEYQIPKKVLLIWVGPKPATKDVLAVADSWGKHQPDWAVKLWGNEDSEALINEMRKKFPKVGKTWDAAVKYAEKADIIRYCILYKEGGIYTDTDLPCFGKVDDIHCYADFCAGIEQNDHSEGILYTGNALIAAKPGHPIIEGCLKNLKPRKKGEKDWDIIKRTGPGLLTNQIYKGLFSDKRNGTQKTLLLPPAYFYPLHSGSHKRALGGQSVNDCVLSWSKGLHLWNVSWQGN